MSAGEIVEAAAACIWLGTYLFTNFVVSPALLRAVADPAKRTAIRSVIGRRYGALAAPLFGIWLVAILVQPMSAWMVTRALGLILLLVAAGWHGYVLGRRMQVLAKEQLETDPEKLGGNQIRHVFAARQERVRQMSARLTVVSLLLSVALAMAALLQVAGVYVGPRRL